MAMEDDVARSVYQDGKDLTKWSLKFIFSFLKKAIDSKFEKKMAERPKAYTDRQKFIADHRNEIKFFTSEKEIFDNEGNEIGTEPVQMEFSREEAEKITNAMRRHNRDVLIQKTENSYIIGYEAHNDLLIQDIGKTLGFIDGSGKKATRSDKKPLAEVKQDIAKQREQHPEYNGRQDPIKHQIKDIGAR